MQTPNIRNKAFVSFLMLSMLFSTDIVIAQNNDTAVLKEAIKILSYMEPIIYLGEVNVGNKVPARLIEKFEKGKFYNFEPDSQVVNIETGEITLLDKSSDSLILSDEEKQILIQQIQQEVIWPINLFAKSIKTTSDSASYYRNYVNSLKINRNKNHSSSNRKSTKRAYSFSFTKPIYFRNNSTCFLAFAAICGGECGITEYAFYKKINGHWVKWIVIGGGEF